jgi:Tfp pilus assembly protein PilZ
MKITSPDRRLTRRLSFKTPLRVRIWKSKEPERRAESMNLSQTGVFFATDAPIREGETVEILLKMPEELTSEPTTEWRCTGHVVRVGKVDSARGHVGVGVQFDCYEVSRAEITSTAGASGPGPGDSSLLRLAFKPVA